MKNIQERNKGKWPNYIINNLTEPTNIKNIEIANEFFKRQLIENDNLGKPTELFLLQASS